MARGFTLKEKRKIIGEFWNFRKEDPDYTPMQYLHDSDICISGGTFSKWFKEIFGVPFTAYKDKRRAEIIKLYEKEKRENPSTTPESFLANYDIELHILTFRDWLQDKDSIIRKAHKFANIPSEMPELDIKIDNKTSGKTSKSKSVDYRIRGKTQAQGIENVPASSLLKISEFAAKKIKINHCVEFKKKYFAFETKDIQILQKFVAMILNKVQADKYTEQTREYLEQNLMVLLAWFNNPLIIERIDDTNNECNVANE